MLLRSAKNGGVPVSTRPDTGTGSVPDSAVENRIRWRHHLSQQSERGNVFSWFGNRTVLKTRTIDQSVIDDDDRERVEDDDGLR